MCLKLLTERCCFLYRVVPGNNSECVVTQGQTMALRCEVVVPRDGNNNPVETVRWYRSIDLVTSVDITNEYTIQKGLTSSEPFSSGRFAGLYGDTYILLIRNISSSDSGYYWCQIITNETCSSPSPYVNISVSTVSTDQCPFVDYWDNPVCANVTTCDLQSTPATVVPTVPEVLRLSTTLLTATSSLPPPILSNPTPSTLVGSLSSIIALLVFTLLLTIIVFVVAWKKREKRVQVQCKVFYLTLVIGACNN